VTFPQVLRPVFRFRYAVIAAGVILLGMAAVVVFIPANEARQNFADGIYPAINFLASIALFYAARQSFIHSRRLGLAWSILTVAQLSYALADLAWFILEAILHQSPYPSIADVFYLAYYPLLLLGILLFPGKHFSTRGWLETALDFTIIMLVACLGFWNYLLGPLASYGSADPWLKQILSLAYPVGDLILFWALMFLAYRRSQEQDRGPIYLLCAAVTIMIVTDCIYSYETLADTYVSGGLVDLGYLATVLITGLAGILHARSIQSHKRQQTPRLKIEELRNKPGSWRSYFPYVWVGLGIGLLVQSTLVKMPMNDTSIAIGVGFVIALVLIRQIIAQAENAHLYRQLEQTTQRVQQKTEETEWNVRRLIILRSIDQAILTSPNLERTLDVVMEQITSQLGIDAANILLFHPASQTLEISANLGLAPSLYENTVFKLGESHAGQVALQRKMQVIPDLRELHDSLTARVCQAGNQFVGYVALPLVAKGEIKGVLQLFQRTCLDPNPDWINFLQALADQAAIAIDNAQLFIEQQLANLHLMLAYDDTIDGWSRALDLRDRETEGHSQRVTDFTIQLARRLGMADTDIPHIRRGAQLHDIGKMGIPDSILLKPGPLTADEWDIMRRHPQYAYDLLSPIQYLHPALDIPYCHHERWDGAGYPRRLKGEEIPLAARIFSVVDVWDALRHDRPYRPAWGEEKAVDYLRGEVGISFDPKVVEAFLELVGEKQG
jgi:HD-GYP domain-containing protein (c-di-GMP phosphodiesterase class II)